MGSDAAAPHDGDAPSSDAGRAQCLFVSAPPGIVHRDVKPANVLLTTDGFAKLVDFGVAKLLRDPGLTRTGAAIGTVPYMSPEQLHGDAVDHRIDIWAMGVVLYEMLTGVGPFIREDSAAVSRAILHETPTPPSARRTGVPLELERIVMRALEKRREDRYQTVADLVSKLRRLKRETDGYVEPLTRDATAVVRQGSRGRRAALVIAAVAVVAAVVAFALRDRGGTLLAVARLRDGVTLQQADAQLQALRAYWTEKYPDHYATGHFAVTRDLHEDLVGEQRQALMLLGGAVLFVLLIVCVNLAALLVSRSEALRREFAVRQALGANRRRLVRQLLGEAMLLAAAGGVAGILLANWLLAGLLALYPQRLPVWQSITIDTGVTLFALLLIVAAGFAIGLVPAPARDRRQNVRHSASGHTRRDNDETGRSGAVRAGRRPAGRERRSARRSRPPRQVVPATSANRSRDRA
jgi:hypothetical protein